MERHPENNQSNEPLLTYITTQESDPDLDLCKAQKRSEPCMIVIVGASGDLTERKIVPALYRLFVYDELPRPCIILGCSRTELSDHEFRVKMEDACLKLKGTDTSKWQQFSETLFYRTINYNESDSYGDLTASIRNLENRFGTRGNRIFYLAIPPTIYESTTEMLGKANLSNEYGGGNGWSRIVVEKPFGHDLSTAMNLDRKLHEYFKEHQIFRIDHYLGKETVQNILTFRFANAVFEPLWNRNFIDHVHIIAIETLGVEHRAGYYEQAGVLRDMFQNHMMQLLALTAMEPPSRFEAEMVRDEKVKVYRSLRPFRIESINDHLVLGQYTAGIIDEKQVPAYRDEPGVSPESSTPTYAMMKLFLDNWRWKGIPFFLTSGKRLKKKRTEIHIQFKEVPHSMFRQALSGDIIANRLILGIYPEEKISLTFQTKNPGARMCLRSVTMDFNYHQGYSGPAIDAYEKVLLDCMLGDQILFWRQDGVELCWSFLTPILEECEKCGNGGDRLRFYGAGTWGPNAFMDLGEIR